MSDIWGDPKYATLKRSYAQLLDVTEEQLRAAVEQLSWHLRDALARGPLPYRYDCRVCESFGSGFYKGIEYDLSNPMHLVFGYHEAPKVNMTHRDHQHYGPHANATYTRCIATYRAAGWSGDAEEPNA